MIGIYKITNTITNEVYIGQTIDLQRRRADHFCQLRKGMHYNKHLQASFNKYKELAFDFDIVEVVEDIQRLNDLEIYYIKLYNSFKLGYNQTAGGSIGEQNKDNILYTFYHKDGRIEENITKTEFASKYRLDNNTLGRLIKGKFHNFKGWRITKEPTIIYQGKLYTFYNTDGRVEYNLQVSDMCKKYNLHSINLYRTYNGERNHTKGWSMLPNPIKRNISIFSVIHSDGTIERDISIRSMATKYHISRDNLLKLSKGVLVEYKGWKLINNK